MEQDGRQRLTAGGQTQVCERGGNLFLEDGFGQWGKLALADIQIVELRPARREKPQRGCGPLGSENIKLIWFSSGEDIIHQVQVIHHDLVAGGFGEIKRSTQDSLVQLDTESLKRPGYVIELNRTGVTTGGFGWFGGDQQTAPPRRPAKKMSVEADFDPVQEAYVPGHGGIITFAPPRLFGTHPALIFHFVQTLL